MRWSCQELGVKITLVVLALLGAPSSAIPEDAASANGLPEKPNIVYILADDLGYGDLSCYGQKVLSTPHIDRLAREGTRFTQHYAGATVCAPSRCVLLTGLHGGHARIRDNSQAVLRDADITVAELLRGAGYRTGCMGKWGVGRPPSDSDPNHQGFDEFFGYVSMMHAHNFYPPYIIRQGEKTPLRNELTAEWKVKSKDGRGVAEKRVDYVPHLVTREALEFIERNQRRPFFLYYALNVPHANNEAKNRGMEVPPVDGKAYGEFSERDWPDPEKGFAAMLRNIDNDVGSVLAKLKELGLEEKTLVIFTSDNGPHAEGGHKMPFFDSNGALRGFKRDLYDGGIRVPMIARWPGQVPAGVTSDHISGFQDMLPTFVQLAGMELPPTDGISMVPVLTGQNANQRQHDYLYWETTGRKGIRALRKGHWKVVRFSKPEGDSVLELFDLRQDIGEETNVAASHPEVVAELVKLLEEAHVEWVR